MKEGKMVIAHVKNLFQSNYRRTQCPFILLKHVVVVYTTDLTKCSNSSASRCTNKCVRRASSASCVESVASLDAWRGSVRQANFSLTRWSGSVCHNVMSDNLRDCVTKSIFIQ